MICVELWQFVSTEDLASLGDTHPGGLAFAELYPHLLNQPAWSDSPFCQVQSDLTFPSWNYVFIYVTFPPWQCIVWLCGISGKALLGGSSFGETPAKEHGRGRYFGYAGWTVKKRKKSKQVDETSGILRWKKRWGHCRMTITGLVWGYWSVTTLKSYRYSVFSPQAAKTLLTHSA